MLKTFNTRNLLKLSAVVNTATIVIWTHSILLHMIQEIDSIESSMQYLHPPDLLAVPDKCMPSSLLSPLNQRVDEYDNTILDLLPGEGCKHAVKCFLILLLATNITVAVFYSFNSLKEYDGNSNCND